MLDFDKAVCVFVLCFSFVSCLLVSKKPCLFMKTLVCVL